MASGYWRIASGLLLVPVAVAGLAGCGGAASSGSASGTSAAASGTSAASTATSNGGFTAAMLRGALLTRVNGVAAAAPASSGTYSSLTAPGKKAASAVQVSPKACAGAAAGFDPTVLASAPAAAVSFRVGPNAASEALIASSPENATAALAGQLPAECGQIKETIGGKTYTYSIKEQPVAGIGEQARVLSVEAVGTKSADLWSLIYRGAGFVGTVTVVGANASQKAVTELGQQAYAYAAKTLS